MMIKPKFILMMIVSLIAAEFGFAGMARAEDLGYTYIGVEDAKLSTDGAIAQEFKPFDGKMTLTVSPQTLRAQGRIQLTELELTADSALRAPDGYLIVSPIFEYELKNTAFLNKSTRIKLNVGYDSSLEFEKFAMRYDLVKEQWKELESLTDLTGKTASFESGASRLIFAIFDTDAMTQGHASWYRYKKCMCAASPDYPKGTKLLVTNQNNGKSIVVRVNDWGPERDIFPLRVIDLDLVAFEKLGKKGAGVLTNIKVVPFIPGKFDEKTVTALTAGEAMELAVETVKITQVDPKPAQNINSMYLSADEEARAAYLAYMKQKAN